jgi:hypothetical protein
MLLSEEVIRTIYDEHVNTDTARCVVRWALGVGSFEIRGGAPVRLEVLRLAPRAALFGPWQLRIVANYRHICTRSQSTVHNIGHGTWAISALFDGLAQI